MTKKSHWLIFKVVKRVSRLLLVTPLVCLCRCLTMPWLSSLLILDITLHTRGTDPNLSQRPVDIFSNKNMNTRFK